MKKTLLILLGAALFWQAHAAELTWLTDLPKAQEQAKAENKIVLLDFTGSDWCEACALLKKKVLVDQKFIDYASKNLVLVEVDFPHKKEQPADLKKANQALSDKYKIEGYPTLVVLDKDGKEIGRQEGFDPGSGPEAFIAGLEKFKGGK